MGALADKFKAAPRFPACETEEDLPSDTSSSGGRARTFGIDQCLPHIVLRAHIHKTVPGFLELTCKRHDLLRCYES